jgi:hypothetical protein
MAGTAALQQSRAPRTTLLVLLRSSSHGLACAFGRMPERGVRRRRRVPASQGRCRASGGFVHQSRSRPRSDGRRRGRWISAIREVSPRTAPANAFPLKGCRPHRALTDHQRSRRVPSESGTSQRSRDRTSVRLVAALICLAASIYGSGCGVGGGQRGCSTSARSCAISAASWAFCAANLAF